MKTVPSARWILCLFGITLFAAIPAAAPARSTAAQPAQMIVAQNYYYAKPGKVDEVYRWRLHASDVRARLGFARGRVLRHIHKPGARNSDVPDVVWECVYPSEAARARDYAAVTANPEFQGVEKHMLTLLRRFEAGAYEVQEAPQDTH